MRWVVCDDWFLKEDKNEVINEIIWYLEVGLREKFVGCVEKNVEMFSKWKIFLLLYGRIFLWLWSFKILGDDLYYFKL